MPESKPQKDFAHIVSRQYRPNPEACCEKCCFGSGAHTCGREEESPAAIGTMLLVKPGAIRLGVELDERGGLVVKAEVDPSGVTAITNIGPPGK